MSPAHAAARNAGMTPAEAARWLAYLTLKKTKGEAPISVYEAARQCREARPR